MRKLILIILLLPFLVAWTRTGGTASATAKHGKIQNTENSG